MRAMWARQVAGIDSSPLELVEIADPEPGRGEVRLRVRCCAICRTDLHVIEGDLPAARQPIIPGHQVVGVVDRLGSGCTRLSLGDRVGIAWLRQTCGTCAYCRSRRENLCEAARFTGYHEHGGYAECAVVREDFAYRLPAGLDDAQAAPLLCAGIIGYRALQRAEVPARGRLGLFGFGSSAHIVLQLARARGAEVHVVSRSAGHRRLARELGAVWAGSSAADLPVALNSAILFAPAGALVPDALAALDKGGTLALAGIHMSDVPTMSYERHLFYEKNLRSVTANTRADGEALLAEAARCGAVAHTQLYALRDANRALQDLKADRINGTGILVCDAERERDQGVEGPRD